MQKIMKKSLKKVTSVLLTLAMMLTPMADAGLTLVAHAADITVSASGGYEEGAYVEWAPVDGADGYIVYTKKEGESEWTEIDDELIRRYPTYYRADALGLASGTYSMKIEAATFDTDKHKTGTVVTKEIDNLSVTNYDRSGFAFSAQGEHSVVFNGSNKTMPGSRVNPADGLGAYKADGTLKDGAQVLYVTAATAKTVKANIHTSATKVEEFVGLQAILDAKQKDGAYTSQDILDIRIIGKISAADMDSFSSSAEGVQIKGKAEYTTMNITVEGVGKDATVHSFGFLVKNCTSVEFRNFAIMNCMDDCISIDTANSNIWVHNMDFFYGKRGSGDKAKGDGTVDMKDDSQYLTISYNHFFDSGKCSLCGMKGETLPNYITYHHNWFDHSDSRHPRIRSMSVHVYNNYFDGNAKYGVGACTGANAFVENNYFRNVVDPMMISLQGTDAKGDGTFSDETGGMIKAYNNYITGAHSLVYANAAPDATNGATDAANTTSFDAYLASTRDELVPETYVPSSTNIPYTNFDTTVDMGVTTDKIDAPADVPAKVVANAGRVQGGDVSFTFAASEDTNYSIIEELSALELNYTSSLVSVGGIEGASVVPSYTVTFDPDNGEATWQITDIAAGATITEPETPTIPEGKESFDGWYNGSTKWNFSTGVTSDMTLTAKYLAAGESGGSGNASVIKYDITAEAAGNTFTNSTFTITNGSRDSHDDYTSGTYEGSKYTGRSVKIDSNINVTFTSSSKATLVLFLKSTSTQTVKIDGTATSAAVAGIITAQIEAGNHTIAKGSGNDFLFAIWLIPDGASSSDPDPEVTEYTVTLNYDGGSTTDGGDETSTIKVPVGDAIEASDIKTPTKTGYTFDKWVNAAKQAITFPYTPTSDVTIKATWINDATGEPDPDLVNMILKASDIPAGTYTSTFSKNGFTIHATSEGNVTVDSNSKTINGTSYTSRLKMNGAGTKDYRSISFTTQAAATLKIACLASSSSATYNLYVGTLDGEDQFVNYTGAYTIDGAAKTATDGAIPVSGSNPGRYIVLNLPKAGTYYLYGENGINFYGIYVEYEGGVDPEYFTVSYNTNGGLSVPSEKVLAGETCVEPGGTLKTGYTFAGWYADSALNTPFDFTNTPILANTTIYAKWTEGETGTNLILDMAELPSRDYAENFTKNGFSFTATSSKAVSVETSSATVGEKTYTKRFKFNGAGTDRKISFTTTETSTLTIVAASGSVDQARGLAISNGTVTYNTKNFTATAEEVTQALAAGTWTITVPSSFGGGVNIYYLGVVAGGEEPPVPETVYNMSLNVAEDLPAGTYTEDVIRKGFTIHATAEKSISVEGNNQKINNTDYKARLKSGRIGTAEYASISFTTTDAATLKVAALSSASAGATMAVATKNDAGELVDITGGTVAIPAKKDGTNAYSTISLPAAGTYYLYGKDGGVNFYAVDVEYAGGVANPDVCTVTFNTDGGLSVPTQSMLKGEKCYQPVATLKSGYTFENWYSDSAKTTPYVFGQAVNSDTTVFANWTAGEGEYENLVLDMKDLPVRDYAQSFKKNGFTLIGTESKFMTVEDGTVEVDGKTYTRRLKLNGTGKTTERAISFTITAPSTMTIVAASASAGTARALTVTDGTTTKTIDALDAAEKRTLELTAGTWYVYSPADGLNIYYIDVKSDTKYTVTIDKNDGTDEAVRISTVQVNAGQNVTTELVPNPTREGYTFNGWKVNGAAITLPYTPTGNVTLVADWTEGVTQYTITIDKNDGVSATTTVKVDAGQAVTTALVPTPTRAGFTFNGWKVNGAAITLPYTPTGNVTLVADWTENGTPGPGPVDPTEVGLHVHLVDAEAEYVYTGQAIKPAIYVTNNGVILTEGVDYTVKYSNNVNAGSKTAKKAPTITVTGKGNLSGKATAQFTIAPKLLTEDDDEIGIGSVVVQGATKAPKAVPVITYNGMTLKNKKDFTVEYVAGTEGTDGVLKVTGKGNYTTNDGTSTTIEIPVKVVEKLKKLNVVVNPDKTVFTYNGDAQEAVVKVYDSTDKAKATPLKSVDDADAGEEASYAVYYSNNVNAGNATVTVVGMGEYTGIVTKKYAIKPLKVADGSITVTGVKTDGYTFTSKGATIKDDDTEITVTYAYTDADGAAQTKDLTEGVDYKLTYKNNKKVVYDKDKTTVKAAASYTVSFLGNYKGSKAVTGEYKINPASLSALDAADAVKVVAADKVYTKKNAYVSKPFVTVDGVLLKTSDYTVEYYKDSDLETKIDSKNPIEFTAEQTEQTVYIKVTGKGNYAPAANASDDYVTGEYKVVKGADAAKTIDLSKAKVTVVAVTRDKDGNITGSTKIAKVAYTGEEINLDNSDIGVKIEYKDPSTKKLVELTADEYAALDITYVNNVNKGKASIVINAAEANEVVNDHIFVGSKTATFSIVARDLAKDAPDFLTEMGNLLQSIF